MTNKKRPATSRQMQRRGAASTAPARKAPQTLIADVRKLIEESRQAVAQTVNTALVWLYWNIGKRIREDVLKQKRAEYGEQMVATLSQQLTAEYGRGFGRRNLFNMLRFAESFPSFEIVQTLSAQLSWSHFVLILPFDNSLQRDFYAELCRVERWSVRTLQKKINGMLFERTALSKKPAKLARQELDALRAQDRLTPDLVFRDPYLLDFLGLQDTYAEKDLEAAILRELETFILELGSASRSSPAKTGSRWTARITISTCCFTIAGCAALSPSTSSSAVFRRPTRDRWNFTSAGSNSRRCSPAKSRRWV